MLGGGYFTSYNKKLPGTYVNYTSARLADASLSERGRVFMGITSDWLEDGKVLTVTAPDFEAQCLEIFAHDASDAALVKVRELFRHATTAYLYKLNSGGVKASCAFGSARCPGTRGNSLTVSVAVNADDENLFDVATVLGGRVVDEQTVASAAGLADNSYVIFDKTATLAASAGTVLTGGADGTATGAAHTDLLDAAEGYSFNVLAYDGTDATTKALYSAYTRRQREEVGRNFQLVASGLAADYEGVINVKNGASLVPWVAGAEAGCRVESSLENMTYDGELAVPGSYTQAQLAVAIESGELVLHRMRDGHRVLKDINSLVTYTPARGRAFAENTVIRVNDQIGNDVAAVFNNEILGKVPNDAAGRLHVWNRLQKIMDALADRRAISGYESSDLTVSAVPEDPTAVAASMAYTPLRMMSKLYMTCIVS